MNPYVRPVYYYETDRMGIVHHSNYIKWLEEARIDYLSQIGLPYDEIEKKGILIPVLSVFSEYKKPFRFGDILSISSHLIQFSGLRFTMRYEISLAKTGETHAAGESTHAFVNEKMLPIRLKKEFPAIYQGMVEHLET